MASRAAALPGGTLDGNVVGGELDSVAAGDGDGDGDGVADADQPAADEAEEPVGNADDDDGTALVDGALRGTTDDVQPPMTAAATSTTAARSTRVTRAIDKPPSPLYRLPGAHSSRRTIPAPGTRQPPHLATAPGSVPSGSHSENSSERH